MNLITLERFFKYPLIEWKMRRSVNRRYTLKSTIDIVRKFEEVKYKHLEASKNDPEKAEMYKNFKDALAWVLNVSETNSDS